MDTANNNELSAGLNLNTGDIVECVVEQIMPYGAFVRIGESGRKGMIHISELSYNFVKDINEVVKIQDKIKAKIIKIDERGRIDLSLKQTMTPPVQQHRTPRTAPQFNQGNRVSNNNFRPSMINRRPATGAKFAGENGRQSASDSDNDNANNNNGFRGVRDFHEMREAYREANPAVGLRPEASDRQSNFDRQSGSESFEKKMASFLKTSEAKITDLNSRNSARSGRSTRRRNSRD